MNRAIFALFLCAIALVSYSECVPVQNSAETIEFERRRDESVRQLIEKEGITCDNVKEFCKNKDESLSNQDAYVVSIYCTIVLEPYVCKGQKL